MNKRRYTVLAVLLAVLCAAGCSSAKNSATSNSIGQNAAGMSGGAYDTAASVAPSEYMESEAYYDRDAIYGDYEGEAAAPEEAPMAAYENAVSGTTASQPDALQPEKIIRNAGIDMQTDRFDETVEQLRNTAPDFGGYVESANLYGSVNSRYFNITLRVPSDRFEQARRHAESLGQVTNAWQNAEDVSARYYDIASRLETKRIEEERVLDMITRATDIKDLLSLERRLGEIRTQIERYQSQMTSIDRLSAYSTIQVSLAEVTKEELIISSDNLGGRISKAFTRSINRTAVFFQEIVIFLAGALIPLAVIGLVLFIGIKTAFAVHHKKNGRSKNAMTKKEK